MLFVSVHYQTIHTIQPTNAQMLKQYFLHNLSQLRHVSICFAHPWGVSEHHQHFPFGQHLNFKNPHTSLF